MSEENSWLGRRVVAAGATLLAVGTLAWAAPALASSGGDPQATVVDDASTINWVTPDDAGGPPPLPDDMGENPRPGMDPVGAPEKRHGAAEGEVLAPPVKIDPECAPADDCVTLWVWAASMMVDPDITIRQMNAWRAQAAEKGVCNAEGEPIAGEPLVWSDSLAFAAQELAVELALGADPATLERLDGSGSVINGEGNTFFPNTHITGVNISNLTSIQGTLDAWYVQSEAYWYGPQSTVYYTTGDYANAVSNEAKAVGMASVMLSNQEVYTVCLFGDAAPEEVDGTTYAPTTGGAIYQGVNVQKDKLIFELVAPETLTVGEPVELGINASTTLTGNAVGRAAGVAIDPTELFEQATVQVVQDGKVVGEIAGGKLRALGGFVSGPATLQVVMADEVVASAEVEVVAVPTALGESATIISMVPSGDTLELPQTMSVLWTGGATTDEPVTWEALTDEQLAMLKSREGGSFEVAGTVETLGEDVTVKVTVLPAVPVYAGMPPAQEIWVGGTPALPETLTVTWSNGDVSDEPVTWDELDTTVAGTLTATGTIEGLSSPVTAQVTIKPLEVASVEGQDVELDIASGEMNTDTLFAALPATASVSWSDGSVTEEPIAWSVLPGEQEAALSSRGGAAFTLSGVVGETGVAASAKIKVEAATMVSAEAVPAQEVWVGGAPELPGTVAVTWSNGDVTDEPVSWGAADTSQPGSLEVQGAVEGLADPVAATVDVKAPEAVSAGLSDVEAQTLEVEPGAVPDLPATVQVSWSDGQTSEESVVWDVPSAEEFAAGTDVKISGEVEATQQSVEVTVHVKDEEPVPAPQTESDSDKDAATAADTKAGEGDAESQAAASPTKPDAAAEQSGKDDKADQGDSASQSDAAADTSQPGSLEVAGSVEGLADPVVATVDVKAPEAVSAGDGEPMAASVPSGAGAADALAALPQTVPVAWSDGSVTDEPVAWAEPDAEQLAALSSREGGTVEVQGAVGDTGQAVSATVEVAPAEPVSAQAPQAQEVWVGGAPELPGTVAVTWSNGDVTDEPVSWGAADTS
ncbi:Ig-like domain-containing protein, partial [Paratractidigestivibacter faecalis]|uniref:Ig-like domain-containing protein n=1 Tax=Paratractidigestivibacter faecalis TaxID=2292441 RepID=UPI003AB19F62